MGFAIKKVLDLLDLSRSIFYYKPNYGKQGRKPYAVFFDQNGIQIDSETVLKSIITLFENKFSDRRCGGLWIF